MTDAAAPPPRATPPRRAPRRRASSRAANGAAPNDAEVRDAEGDGAQARDAAAADDEDAAAGDAAAPARGPAIDAAWVLRKLIANVEACMTPGATYSPAAANKALELLGKEHRLFADKRAGETRTLEQMNAEELIAVLGGEPSPEELRAAAGAAPAGGA